MGNPNLGSTYAYTLRARESGGLASANYGSVTCPADIVALINASLSGPASGVIGQPYNFQASLTPLNASLPITYTWQATDQGTTVVISNTSSTRSIQWSNPGIKQITVSAVNASGVTVQATKNISIYRLLFLPHIRK